MTRNIVISIAFFLLATLLQLGYIGYKIADSPPMDMTECFPPITVQLPTTSTRPPTQAASDASFRMMHLRALVWLEKTALENRYHQSRVALLSMVWRNYLGFLTGMILSLVGAVFILGKMQESVSQMAAKGTAIEVSLKSASPGILLAGFGVALVVTTIITRPEVRTVDSSIYLGESTTLRALSAPDDKEPSPKEPPLPADR